MPVLSRLLSIVSGALRAIAETRDAESGARQRDRFLQELVTASPLAIMILAPNGTITRWSPAAERLFGWSDAEVLGGPCPGLNEPEAPELRTALDRVLLRGEGGQTVAARMPRKDGSIIDVQAALVPLHDPAGDIRGVLALVDDRSVWTQSEQALRDSERRYRLFAENVTDVIFVFDLNLRPVYISPSVMRLRGYTVEESMGQSLEERLTPDSVALALKTLAEALTEPRDPHLVRTLELEATCKDGSTVWTETQMTFLRDEAGDPVGILGVSRNISERKRLERAQAARIRQQALVLEVSQRALDGLDVETLMHYAVRHLADALDVEYSGVFELTPERDALWLRAGVGWSGGLAESRRAAIVPDPALIPSLLATTPLVLDDYSNDARFLPDSALHEHAVVSGISIGLQNGGGVAGILGAYTTGRRTFGQDEAYVLQAVAHILATAMGREAAERALRRSEHRFRSLIENAQDIITIQAPDGKILYTSPSNERVLGYELGELIGRDAFEVIHPEDRATFRKLLAGTGGPGGSRAPIEFRVGHKDGSWRWLEGVATPALGDPEIKGIIINSRDITERHQAEVEKRGLEEQLRQAQKLEAIGRLAGGVAHDFNNILTVITGRTESVLSQLPPGDLHRRELGLVVNAAHRAASITHQLLAFSRKQLIHLRVVDLNAVLAGIAGMLRRLIGEDLELAILPGASPAWVKADPTQLEQIILNLAVNARDAMPDGGQLTMETNRVTPDSTWTPRRLDFEAESYVVLIVSDTGTGMDEATKARVFEPFFTTKEVGRGTGLGLATVYGIVQQHDGHIDVESEVGHGTTFKIYFPSADPPAEGDVQRTARTVTARGSETVLLVEDDEEVRHAMAETLGSRGYVVLVARDPVEALRIVRTHEGSIRLLLSDVVMPQMSGPELAATIQWMDKRVGVLYVSGYADEALGRRGVLDPGIPLLEKPFTPEELAGKVREVLDAGQAPQRHR
jgi:PAS domain S-box-containing protein